MPARNDDDWNDFKEEHYRRLYDGRPVSGTLVGRPVSGTLVGLILAAVLLMGLIIGWLLA